MILSLGRDDLWPGIRGWQWNSLAADDDELAPPALTTRHQFVGFGYTHWGHRTNRYVMLAIPHWSLVAMSLIVGATRWWPTLRAQSRRRRHLCLACGYSLTGNVSGTCPECGTAIPAKASEAGATA